MPRFIGSLAQPTLIRASEGPALAIVDVDVVVDSMSQDIHDGQVYKRIDSLRSPMTKKRTSDGEIGGCKSRMRSDSNIGTIMPHA